MKTMSLLILLTLTTSFTFAAEKVQILKADVVGESRYVDLFLELDENKDAQKLYVTEYQNGHLFGETVFHGEMVNNGVLLLSIKSYEILKLIAPNFTPFSGGNITLDYLYNGITGSRGSVDFDLVRSGDEWQLFKNNVMIENISIIKNKKLWQDVGIKRIEYN